MKNHQQDVVELVMAPVHADETRGYMESKVSEHRYRYLHVFPEEKLKPKHRLLKHYITDNGKKTPINDFISHPTLMVSRMTQVAVEVLKESIKESFARQFQMAVVVNMTNKVTILGTDYCFGMLLPFGSTGGLPGFNIIVHESPVLF